MVKTKKVQERYKDWKFHHNIHVKLENEKCHQGQTQFNTTKNNVALLSGSEIVFAVLFIFIVYILIIVHRWKITGANNFFQQFLLKETAMRFIWNIVLPIGYFIKKKDMRKYIRDYICYLFDI